MTRVSHAKVKGFVILERIAVFAIWAATEWFVVATTGYTEKFCGALRNDWAKATAFLPSETAFIFNRGNNLDS